MKKNNGSRRVLDLLIFLPFVVMFVLLIIDSFHVRYASLVNVILIGFIGFMSVVLFVVSLLAYLRTRKSKFFYIMMAFLFFLMNSVVLVVGLIFSLSLLKVEVISNLFYLGTLLWLLLPVLK